MNWILYVAAAIGGSVLIILAAYLISVIFELISGTITHVRWKARAEKELRFRIGELDKKVLGSNED